MKRSKELAVCGMLTALAIILSIVERMFPLDAIIPIPGVKLGLANVVTLFALTRLGLRDSLAVVVVRVTLASLLMGSVTAFLFSLFGGLLALFVMWALLHAEGKFCSLLGVSVAGAAAHNIGQIAAAVLWMKTTAVLAYLPYLLLMSVPLGLVTGLVCAVVLTHMKKTEEENDMKMLLTMLIALLCAFGLSACGSNTADTPNKDTQQNQTDNNAGTNSADTETNVPPEENVNSQGPDGTAGDGGTVGSDIENAVDDAGNAVGGAMDDVGDAAKNAGKAVSDAVKPK